MKKEDFFRIKQKINEFKYTSMNYTEFEEVTEYKILVENKNVIMLHGYNYESGKNEYHWASNTAEELIIHLKDNNDSGLITFVPKEWMDMLEQIGFKVYAIWNDYRNPDISKVVFNEEPEYLTEEETEEASQITLLCRGQSRGFTGQSSKWMKEWINGVAPECFGSGTKDSTVIVHRENGKIVGVICTATYSHDSEKGPIVWVREVAVHPSYQGKGIAKKLIMQALVYGKNHGATRAFLMADECNDNAIHLYESLGFKANEDEMEINMVRFV